AVAKKAVAKKAVAKKAPSKKVVAKRTPVKPAKKVAAKRVVVKPAKKSVVKETAVKKSVVKKAAPKKAVAKPVKKSPAKKIAVKKSSLKKSAAKPSVDKFFVPELPVGSAHPARLEVSSAAVVPPVVIASPPAKVPAPVMKQGPSGRVILALVVGIILLAAIVWSNSGTEESDQALPESTPTSVASPTPSETMSESTPTPEATQASAAPAAISGHEAPKNAVGNYTATGLSLTWLAPDASNGLTGYNIEISRNGGAMEMFSTLPATQLSLDLTKSGSSGWTTFRISSVYSDDEVASVKPFGFPGQFS
ncbi:MAG: hypothetical protein H7227_01340, partial [Actinobacteria bacterium]|nr:hypothetical protein [Actinomycetota bacterium]